MSEPIKPPAPSPESAAPAPDDAGPRCDACKGRGWVPGDCHPHEVCGTCNGTGYPKSWAAGEIDRLDAETARLRAALSASESRRHTWKSAATKWRGLMVLARDMLMSQAVKTHGGAICSFCGTISPRNEAAEHMRSCAKHPLAAERRRASALAAELETVRGALDKIGAVLTRLTEYGWKPTAIPAASSWRKALLDAALGAFASLRALAASGPTAPERKESTR